MSCHDFEQEYFHGPSEGDHVNVCNGDFGFWNQEQAGQPIPFDDHHFPDFVDPFCPEFMRHDSVALETDRRRHTPIQQATFPMQPSYVSQQPYFDQNQTQGYGQMVPDGRAPYPAMDPPVQRVVGLPMGPQVSGLQTVPMRQGSGESVLTGSIVEVANANRNEILSQSKHTKYVFKTPQEKADAKYEIKRSKNFDAVQKCRTAKAMHQMKKDERLYYLEIIVAWYIKNCGSCPRCGTCPNDLPAGFGAQPVQFTKTEIARLTSLIAKLRARSG